MNQLIKKPRNILDYYEDPFDSTDEVLEFDEVMKDTVFNSPFTPDELKQLILNQFDNYISLFDTINYFQEFLIAYKVSREIIDLEMDEYIQERSDALEDIYNDFICFMIELILTHLSISIPAFESGTMAKSDIEYLIDEIYKTFILEGRNNLSKIIAVDVIKQLKRTKNPDEATQLAKEIIDDYADKITSISIDDFLIEIGKDNLLDLYEDGIIAGNFFRRFSPHFEQNEDLRAEILNRIILLLYYKDEQKKFLLEGAKNKWINH